MLEKDLREICVQHLQRLNMKALEKQVCIVWNSRMRSTAGRAIWPQCEIQLNPKLLEIAPDEVMPTLLHELAHLIAFARAGRRRIAPHGVEWQQACMELGIAGEKATHKLPLPSNQQRRKYRYLCPICGMTMDRVRKIESYVACWQCCKKHTGGRFHKKYLLLESSLTN